MLDSWGVKVRPTNSWTDWTDEFKKFEFRKAGLRLLNSVVYALAYLFAVTYFE